MFVLMYFRLSPELKEFVLEDFHYHYITYNSINNPKTCRSRPI